jgi:protocatechuate 3,4-dioxygenase beta subunit
MKKLVFALASLGVLLLGFSLAFLLVPAGPKSASVAPRDGTPASGTAAPAGAGSDPAAGAAELLAAGPTDGGPAAGDVQAAPIPRAEERAAVVTLKTARTVGTWTLPTKRMISGRVEIPAGAPADPTLSVVAFTVKPKQPELYGRFGALSQHARELRGIDAEDEDRREQARVNARNDAGDEADADAGAAADAATEALAGSGVEGDRAVRAADERPTVRLHGLVAIAPVDADGTFEIPLPSGVEDGWLAIDGRYLYSESAAPVAAPDAGETVLQARVGGWLTGRVSLPDDLADAARTLRDLRVTLAYDPSQFNFMGFDFSNLFERLAVPDEDGRFEFRGVPTAPPYVVSASSDDLADASRTGISLGDGRDEHVELVLTRGARVAGVVLDEHGRPVGAADVRAATGSLFGMATNGVGDAKTDAQGRFEFPHLPPGKVQLVARSKGYLDAKPKNLELVELGAEENVELELSRGASVGGVVRLPDGTPATEVLVVLGFDPDALGGMAAFNAARGAKGKGRTDAEGRFLITGLGLGPFVVSAATELDGVGHAARIAPVKPGSLELELRLLPDPTLEGLVTTPEGVPIPKFEVRAEQDGVAIWAAGDSTTESIESEDGSFRLPGMRAGQWRVRASAPGRALSDWSPVTLPRADGSEPIVLVLPPEALAEGRVLDPDGNPVAGATVRQERDLMQTMAAAAGDEGSDAARTDADGAFRLGGLTAGSVSLVAMHPDFVESLVEAVEVAAGAVASDVVLRLRVGGVVTGEVFGAEGKPAGGAMIILTDAKAMIPTMFKAEPDGTFRRESVKPGRYQVTAMIGEIDANELFDDKEPDLGAFLAGMRTGSADVKEGEMCHVVLGAAPADPVRLTGTVRHVEKPVAKAMVSLYPEGGEGIGAIKYTTTDAAGRYEVVLEMPGNYLMQVQILGANGMQQDSMEFQQLVPEGEEAVIDVDLPTGRLSGRVRGYDGKPIAGARVTVTVEGGVGYGSFLGGRYVETQTDEDGTYAIDYLDPNVYAVAAGGALFGGALGGRAEGGRLVHSGLVVAAGDWLQDVDFRLQRPGEIAGRVLDVTGKPVPDASIFVRDEAGRVLERFSMCSTDGAGGFRYTGVAPGRYTASARTEDLAGADSGFITVPEGGVGQAVITLEAGTTLMVSVVDGSDDVVKAKIIVADEAGRQVNGMASYHELLSGDTSRIYSTTEQPVGPLPPGRYDVTAVASDGRTVTKPVTLSGQKERRLKIRLK